MRWLVVHLVLLGLPGIAWAGEAEARRHRDLGFEHFVAENWELGIREMERAFAEYPHPDFLFNIAVAYRRWGRCFKAHQAIFRFISSCANCSGLADGLQERGLIQRACPTRTLTLSTDRVGGALLLDGHAVAVRRSLTASVTIGAVAVTVLDDETSSIFQVVVPASSSVREVVLSPGSRMACVRVDGLSADDTWILDGQRTVVGRAEVEPGPHEVVLERQRMLLDIGAGQCFVLRVKKPPTLRPSPPPPRALVETPSVSPAMTTAAWVSSTLALGAAVTGAVLLVSSQAAISREAEAVSSTPPPAAEVIEGIREEARRDALGAHVAFGVAGAAAVTGVLLFLLAD